MIVISVLKTIDSLVYFEYEFVEYGVFLMYEYNC